MGRLTAVNKLDEFPPGMIRRTEGSGQAQAHRCSVTQPLTSPPVGCASEYFGLFASRSSLVSIVVEQDHFVEKILVLPREAFPDSISCRAGTLRREDL